MIITYNEEANIARTLQAVRWAKCILIVDSGSTDATLEIVGRYPQARVVARPFDSFARQCNFGLEQVTTPWVLSMDADYEVSGNLAKEIAGLAPVAGVAGYSASFVYRIHGRSLRATLYPARTVLYRRDRARYRDEGHGHRVEVEGEVAPLSAPIFHDDRKPLSRWIASQQRYARTEAEHLLAAPKASLGRNDRIRLMAWPAPMLVFLYTLLVKRCLFDGWPGWYYVLQRTIAEMLIALEILDRRFRTRSAAGGPH
jgi:glycosyltransferase involved in cell wall biosynthesis